MRVVENRRMPKISPPLPQPLSPHLRSAALALLATLAVSVHAASPGEASVSADRPPVKAQVQATSAKASKVSSSRQDGGTGVSMGELAELIDQKISEVAAKRTAVPVVQIRTTGPRVKRAPGSGSADAHKLSAQVPSWAYTGAGGPESWGRLKPEYQQCMSGQRQSPIDIRDGLPVYLDPIQFDYRPTRFRVIDNGHTVAVNFDLGNSITVLGQRYELQKLHFHRPSEERVNGRAYPMSAHLIHKSPSGQFAVVAVLLDEGEPHALIQQVWNNLPLEKHLEQGASAPMDVRQIVPLHAHQYYTYMGSLTTPPCTENVLWMVMKEPMTVSTAQIDLFHRLYPMNARPVQPSAGRMIKEGL